MTLSLLCHIVIIFVGPVKEKGFTDLAHIESGLEGGGAARLNSTRGRCVSLVVPLSLFIGTV